MGVVDPGVRPTGVRPAGVRTPEVGLFPGVVPGVDREL